MEIENKIWTQKIQQNLNTNITKPEHKKYISGVESEDPLSDFPWRFSTWSYLWIYLVDFFLLNLLCRKNLTKYFISSALVSAYIIYNHFSLQVPWWGLLVHCDEIRVSYLFATTAFIIVIVFLIRPHSSKKYKYRSIYYEHYSAEMTWIKFKVTLGKIRLLLPK